MVLFFRKKFSGLSVDILCQNNKYRQSSIFLVPLTFNSLYSPYILACLHCLQPASELMNKYFTLAHDACLPIVQKQITAIFICKIKLSCIIIRMVLLPFPLLFLKNNKTSHNLLFIHFLINPQKHWEVPTSNSFPV